MNIKDNVLNEIRQDYFDIVEVNDDSVTLKSICTGHSWCLSLEGGVIKMLHKNHDKDKYHVHAYWITIDDCLYEIYCHDVFQMNGRRCAIPDTALSNYTGRKPKYGRKNFRGKYQYA